MIFGRRNISFQPSIYPCYVSQETGVDLRHATIYKLLRQEADGWNDDNAASIDCDRA